MDILGPVRQSDNRNNKVPATGTKVVWLFLSPHYHFFFSHTDCCLISLDIQAEEVNLFQPAREFLPMIDEVCIHLFPGLGIYMYHDF